MDRGVKERELYIHSSFVVNYMEHFVKRDLVCSFLRMFR